jgi:hypothetical protein
MYFLKVGKQQKRALGWEEIALRGSLLQGISVKCGLLLPEQGFHRLRDNCTGHLSIRKPDLLCGLTPDARYFMTGSTWKENSEMAYISEDKPEYRSYQREKRNFAVVKRSRGWREIHAESLQRP